MFKIHNIYAIGNALNSMIIKYNETFKLRNKYIFFETIKS